MIVLSKIKGHCIKLNICTKLLGTFLLTLSMAFATPSTQLQGTKNLAEADLKAMIGKLNTIKYKQVFKNERVDNKYYKNYKEKNLDLLSFYTVIHFEALHELIIKNPDFAAYAPFNFFAYKNLKKEKDNKTTWYGHLNTDTMLEIIGEEDETLQKKFKTMISKFDTLVTNELKPTENQEVTLAKPLAKSPLLKMVKDVSDVDDFEDYVEDFMMEYHSIFVDNHFIPAGFSDFKIEYEDLDLELDQYDAFWLVPQLQLWNTY